MSRPICEVKFLGMVPYQTAWDLQARLANDVARGEKPPTLLLLEHPHTYTFGRRGHAENLLWDEAERARRGVDVHWVDRGGDVTYHGPGQLVGYPIIPLRPLTPQPPPPSGEGESGSPLPRGEGQGVRVVDYVRKLEKTLIKTLAELGIATGQIEGRTGVWVQPDVASRCPHCPPASKKVPSKIAAIGVKVDARGITRHGFALNVNTDMEYWGGIVGCGLKDAPVINLADLFWEPPEMETVQAKLVRMFGEVFGFEMRMVRDKGFS